MDIIRIGSLARSHLGDKKAENRLQGYEFEYSPGDIDGAIKLALSKINFTDFPKTVYTVDDCEEYILILGVSYYFIRDYELWFAAFAMGLLVTLNTNNNN